MLGVQRDPHLAAAGEHVDGAVVVLADDRAVGRRRLGELVDLVAERGDVLARLAQGVGQLLVLGRPPGPAGPWSRAAAPRACAPASGASWSRRRSDDDLLLERPSACSRSSASSRPAVPSFARPDSLTGTTSSIGACADPTPALSRPATPAVTARMARARDFTGDFRVYRAGVSYAASRRPASVRPDDPEEDPAR